MDYQQRTQHTSVSPEAIERVVRETMNKIRLEPAPSITTVSSSSAAYSQRKLEKRVCADCAGLSSAQRDDTTRRRLLAGLSGTDCAVCGLASKPETYTKPFCDFLTGNPTIFHAVQHFKDKLDAAGFSQVGVLAMMPHTLPRGDRD